MANFPEVKTCTCSSDYQDKVYGKGKRLCNMTTKGKGNPTYRCTVCNKEHN